MSASGVVANEQVRMQDAREKIAQFHQLHVERINQNKSNDKPPELTTVQKIRESKPDTPKSPTEKAPLTSPPEPPGSQKMPPPVHTQWTPSASNGQHREGTRSFSSREISNPPVSRQSPLVRQKSSPSSDKELKAAAAVQQPVDTGRQQEPPTGHNYTPYKQAGPTASVQIARPRSSSNAALTQSAVDIQADSVSSASTQEASSGYASDGGTTPEDEESSGRRSWSRPATPSSDGKGIISQKGTVRGVQNKVRNALIAFNYEPDIEHRLKQYQKQTQGGQPFVNEEGKVVLYSTSNGIVPEVANRCSAVRKILMNHRVKFEERDLFLSKENGAELAKRMSVSPRSQPDVPQVFIDGIWLGNAERMSHLNETGQLRKTLSKFEKIKLHGEEVCGSCWGYAFVLCRECNGSKKSQVRNGFTATFVGLKCTRCDPNGLQRCPDCK